MQPPPIPSKDAEHLRTLAICHYVSAGLSIVGLAFLFFHYSMMNMFFGNPRIWEKSQAPMPFNPAEFFQAFKWFYLAFGVFSLVSGILTLISGRFIHRRVNRTFSIVIAGLNCLHMPFGTLLGIFTLILLTKDSVIHLYAQAKATTSTDFA
ncbi:hypothetical protein [Prosthecobacter sp.]|uniref:hypothetical protein n=1 Tax=Prosthecobacter sp. TaxID=1965333 RepID=UPI0037846C88